ncbi:Uma2 family endonuclease [Actinoplanes sp. KI2]|uniref:Uma2 family endonuclease n=1 Tax=Actinoplanes sp. KI2 TaxID=2983315 RepID=UPI0021D5DAF0|nr:Uma2 family endonuclease [Actinoplanes sp. KI2]MCU7723697.1 Uma2 family endonuclease [Actinoplanes sp. KI2]
MTAALKLRSLLDEKQDWTVDDLASLPKDLRYELIDGRLILPCPTGFHQILGVELVLALRSHCPPGYEPVPDMSLSVDQGNEPRPDVVVIPERALLRSPVPIDNALLAVEIISPSSRARDMTAKVRDYAAAGVQSYWTLNPAAADGVVLTEFRLGEHGAYDVVTSTSKLFTTEVPYSVIVDLPALTRRRDRLSPPISGR